MGRGRSLGIGIAALLVFGGGVLFLARPVPVVLRLTVTGTAGLRLQGETIVDGAVAPIRAVAPLEMELEGRSVAFTIRSDDSSGEFTVRADTRYHGSPSMGNSAAETSGEAPRSSIRGWANSKWAWEDPDFGIQGTHGPVDVRPPR